ncbi:MAG: toll/interleukin-1 receptor domain-containing protein [Oscillospiraceae bacterium]|jgi:TPR repeat protein|nr:toll/interleukin-1 receptor domain-containing protein [Oscillospiraceae bacterium]
MPAMAEKKIKVHTRYGKHDGTGKPYVFLSHRKVDNSFIDRVEGDLLRAFDCGVWCDRDSIGFDKWDTEIDRAVRAANLMVLIVTNNTFEMGCYVVEREIPLAQGKIDINGNHIPEGQRHPVPILPIVVEQLTPETEQQMNDNLNRINPLRTDSERYMQDLKKWLDDILMSKTDEDNIRLAVKKFESGDKLSIDEGYYLGLGYLNGLSGVIEKDEKVGADKIIGAAYSGFSAAQLKAGNMFYYGDGVEQDYKRAAELYEKAALKDSAVMCNLGWLYEKGEGVRQDYGKAIVFYAKAAELGNAKAMYNLGLLYDNGECVRQDYQIAAEWYSKSAALGNSDAMRNLGALYYNGQGVSQDHQKAADWWRKAAELGNSNAMNSFGVLYYNGQGVPQDYEKATEWWRKAAALGNFSAMNHLGYSYKYGKGVPQDYGKAIEWYKKAAALGNSSAMNNLGYSYKHGQGVPQDYGKAIEWYEKAAALGNSSAKEQLKKMRG